MNFYDTPAGKIAVARAAQRELDSKAAAAAAAVPRAAEKAARAHAAAEKAREELRALLAESPNQ